MTSKNETQHWIAYKGNAKSELTEPETIVRGILKELGYGFRLQEPIDVIVKLEGGMLSDKKTFVIDLFIPEHKICVEVDGIHHRTARQERKAAWRDAQLIANGYKVLHIDAEWTETKERQNQLYFSLRDELKLLISHHGSSVRKIEA